MSFEAAEKLQNIINEKNEEIKQLTARLEHEQLQSESKLQALQAYYENVLAVMPGYVYWLDKNNVFLGCNDLQAKSAQLKSRQDIIGKTNNDMLWKDKAEELNQLNNQVMKTGVSHVEEEYVVMPNGLTIYHSEKKPIRDKNNEVIGVLSVSFDITEQKKMEAALRRAKEAAEVANHAKTEFIANMSHDIHTPLSGIVGLSQLLEGRCKNKEEKQYASWINESGKQLLELLKSVLDIVSDEHISTTEVNKEAVDLRQCIRGLAHLVFPTAKMKALELHVAIDDAVPQQVITDVTKLHRVLLNLLSNAIKFTEKGSVTIKIDTIVDDKDYVQLQFSVIDTGIGIPDEMQNKVFERFFRVNPSRKGTLGGYGVGLHVAQNYVGLLGGEIKLESKLGEGSTFSFILPLKVFHAVDSSKEIEKTNHLRPITSEDSPYILLVEANSVALRFIESLVMQAGCRFASAADVSHALKLIKSNDFDLIFTEIELPAGSGNQLARDIRKWEQETHRKPVPVIGLTTTPLNEMRASSIDAGMNEIINKPVQLQTIQEIINKFIF